MKYNVLVAELGSTITKLNLFDNINSKNVKKIANTITTTTVEEGVTIGIEKGISQLKKLLKIDSIDFDEILINSSAAGGLKMSVHGLTTEMTLKAAKEASLGAGGVLKYHTAGRIRDFNLKTIEKHNPNMIYLCGGVDYGEVETTIENAEKLAKLQLDIPVLYAGNRQLREEIEYIFDKTHFKLYMVDNVYPTIDELNVEPSREIIQHIFSKHIIKAKGMDELEKLTKYEILPTPAVVLNAGKLMSENGFNDLMIIDVGGATTDVHSITDGSKKYTDLLVSPEPRIKRTVEGDLGVYVNAEALNELKNKSVDKVDLESLKPIPNSENEKVVSRTLAKKAVITSVNRHAGTLKKAYTISGNKMIVKGKDLTNIQYIFGTGGALTRLDVGRDILESIKTDNIDELLLPSKNAKVFIDKDYIFSAAGTIANICQNSAIELIKNSIMY